MPTDIEDYKAYIVFQKGEQIPIGNYMINNLDFNYIESGKIGTIYMVEYTSDKNYSNDNPIVFMGSNAHRTKDGCIKEIEANGFREKQTLFGVETNKYKKSSYSFNDYAEILEFYIVD